jgi:histidyl-tRNA synthetase
MPAFQAPKGTFDVFYPQSARYEAFIARFVALVERAGYGLILSPMFEDIGVFQRVGESTDIVRKEMYEFEDKGGRHLALRPEGTASVVRAFIEHRPTLPWKTWYVGPNFRYDRPAAGRYRQHHQVGIEAIGAEDPDLDAEVIALASQTYAAVGLTQVELHLNSMGDGTCRPAYRQALIDHLRPIAEAGGLCDEHREQYLLNPLRVLDCKKPDCLKATADAPRMVDHLCGPCTEHFARVRADLDRLGIPAVLDTRLVRGQDYYTRTTFEFVGLALEAAQNGIGGGGRYDGLSEALGGPPAPGIGFGLGIERILLAADAEGVFPAPPGAVEVFVADTVDGVAALELCQALREAGIGADRAFGARSLKSQLRAADRSGARVALIVGQEEATAGEVTVKDLRAGGGQERVKTAQVLATVRAKLATS